MKKPFVIIDTKNSEEVNALCQRISAKCNLAAKTWEITTDGRISKKIRDNANRRWNKLMEDIEDELSIYGIKCEWPGLYPTFIIGERQERNLKWCFNIA